MAQIKLEIFQMSLRPWNQEISTIRAPPPPKECQLFKDGPSQATSFRKVTPQQNCRLPLTGNKRPASTVQKLGSYFAEMKPAQLHTISVKRMEKKMGFAKWNDFFGTHSTLGALTGDALYKHAYCFHSFTAKRQMRCISCVILMMAVLV